MNPWKLLWVLAVILAFAAFTWRRDPPGPKNPSWAGETMGTLYSIKLADSPLGQGALRELQAEVDRCLVEVNREMSHYQPDSELSQFNRHESAEPFPVSPGFASVVRFALELNRRSGGVFDPTLGPLIDLWGFGAPGHVSEPPSPAQVEEARARIGGQHLSVTPAGQLVKGIPSLRLNLGAVAKGYGVDEVARVIRANGISNLFVEIGGEVVTAGHNAEGQAWRIGVDAPRPDALPGQELETILHLSGLAVATSGDYRNYFVDGAGMRFTHILDPRTGRPIQHNLASVSVVAPDCMTADGLATTLFVMGAEEGMKWIGSWPGVEALFILREPDGRFVCRPTPGFVALTGCALPE
ncbi:MAG TPA: FAD:protein FMN transferase [Kiritimatiellia bacterium]|nr:FAD:protein FMN transferase [Kiritimatiellia bacterium]HRZ11058.1 FAD:protein FMN transferase [Kiritimatiellia bacterium]HSA18631.1 FAD:protein FMN transferase [Kiritimatiellia bacterium]